MEFFVSIDGEKRGPFSLFKVGEMLERGEVDSDTLAWHRGMEGWLPISEVQALETIHSRHAEREEEEDPPQLPDTADDPRPAPPPTDKAPVSLPRNVRPFVRFWARTFDHMLVSVIVWLASDISLPAPIPGETLTDMMARVAEFQRSDAALAFGRALIFAMIGWHLLEGLLIHLFATTPGKALFGIKVEREDGLRLSIPQALGRSFYVYVLGVGFYLPLLSIVGMTFSFFRLLSSGKCIWDQHLDTRVETPPVGPVRIMLAIGAFLGLIMLQSLKFS